MPNNTKTQPNTLYNQAAIFFMSENRQHGLDTVPPPNHCYMLMRLEGGVMYVNPGVNEAPHRFKSGEGHLRRLRKQSPEAGSNLAASLECTVNPIFNHMRRSLHEKNKKIPHCFSDLKIPQIDDPKRKPRHSNVVNTSELNHHYYSVIERYIKFLRPTPITVVDVGVYQQPSYQPLIYGRPMYCHSYLIHTLGLDIGNVLTTRHFQSRLLDWGSKEGSTNFCSTVLYQRKLLKNDWAAQSVWGCLDKARHEIYLEDKK